MKAKLCVEHSEQAPPATTRPGAVMRSGGGGGLQCRSSASSSLPLTLLPFTLLPFNSAGRGPGEGCCCCWETAWPGLGSVKRAVLCRSARLLRATSCLVADKRCRPRDGCRRGAHALLNWRTPARHLIRLSREVPLALLRRAALAMPWRLAPRG